MASSCGRNFPFDFHTFTLYEQMFCSPYKYTRSLTCEGPNSLSIFFSLITLTKDVISLFFDDSITKPR